MIGLVIVTLTLSLACETSNCKKFVQSSLDNVLESFSFFFPKIGPRRIHTVRVRGGNKKYRALRLDVGNFSWGSECKQLKLAETLLHDD